MNVMMLTSFFIKGSGSVPVPSIKVPVLIFSLTSDYLLFTLELCLHSLSKTITSSVLFMQQLSRYFCDNITQVNSSRIYSVCMPYFASYHSTLSNLYLINLPAIDSSLDNDTDTDLRF